MAHPARSLVQISPRVYVATATLWATTSTVVVDGGDALVVDPAATVAEVNALAATIHRRGWRVRAGFSTHPHWDHLLWTPALGAVPRWSTGAGLQVAVRRRDHARAECAAMAPGHDLDYLTSASPLPENTDRIPWPGSLRHESFPGVRLVEHSAHIPGHAGLIVDDVLLAGDMLSDIEVPLLGDEPGAIADYRAGLEALEHAVTASGVRVIVPGHGTPAIGPEAMTTRFAADRAYLDTFEVLTRRAPSPADVTADPRVTGEVARWHAEQLARLREM